MAPADRLPGAGNRQGHRRSALRFLPLQHRSVEAPGPDGSFQAVDALDVDGQRHLTFDEAVPKDVELLRGGEAGRVVRRRWPVAVTVPLSVAAVDAPLPLLRLRLITENTADSVAADASRADVLRTSLVATHSLLGVRGGSFLSLLDPPAWAAQAAKDCRNVHTFPVLAGDPMCIDPKTSDAVLSSPIPMDYDFPKVSPENPGDLFDATEIDCRCAP